MRKCINVDPPLLWTHLGVLGNPVSQHIENSVGSSSADDEFFVKGFFRVTET